MRKLFLFVWLCMMPYQAFAVNTYTNSYYTISTLSFISSTDTIVNADLKGTLEVRFTNTLTWLGGSCNDAWVYVRDDDAHLIAGILTAKSTGKAIRLFADDVDKPNGLTYCFLRGFSYN